MAMPGSARGSAARAGRATRLARLLDAAVVRRLPDARGRRPAPVIVPRKEQAAGRHRFRRSGDAAVSLTAYRELPVANHLDTIKGIGPVTAAVLTAFILDVERFATPGKLVAYFGVLPIEM